jgi:hypothetical protein
VPFLSCYFLQFLQVLDSFTSTFDFSGLSFDVGLRTFLESFKLPGEAQKIDRIINTFGKAYFKHAPDIFANEDAAYILAYSVIMLNTDRHNSQVCGGWSKTARRQEMLCYVLLAVRIATATCCCAVTHTMMLHLSLSASSHQWYFKCHPSCSGYD